MTDIAPGTRVIVHFPSGPKLGTVLERTPYTHFSYTRVQLDGRRALLRIPTDRIRLEERRAKHDPARIPPKVRILRDIADEIENRYPIHAIWLRRMADEMTLDRAELTGSKRMRPDAIVGARSFDRRQARGE